MTTFEKAVAAQGAESLLIEGGYFGIPKAETALDRGLADVNAELRKELTELRAEKMCIRDSFALFGLLVGFCFRLSISDPA